MKENERPVPFEVRVDPPARRAIQEGLPEPVAVSVIEFISGPLRENPYRVGKPLNAPYLGCRSARRDSYRIIYAIDDAKNLITVKTVSHRRDVYRPGFA